MRFLSLRRIDFADQYAIHRQRLVAMMATLCRAPQQQDWTATHDELGTLARLATWLRWHRHRESTQLRQTEGVLPQVQLVARRLMSGVTLARLAVANHEPPATENFVFEKRERARALIGHVDELPLTWQLSRAVHPKQALARLTVAMFGKRLVLGHFVSAMQNLIEQPQHFSRVGIDRQDVVADVTPAVPLADLAQSIG